MSRPKPKGNGQPIRTRRSLANRRTVEGATTNSNNTTRGKSKIYLKKNATEGQPLSVCGRGRSQQMQQEALQNTARRRRFVVNTTALCRGCFVGHARTTAGTIHGFCVESWRRAGPKAKPEGEARRRSPKAKPEGEARRRSPTKKQVDFISAELTRPTPTKTENNAQRTPSGGGTRVTPQTNAEKARPIARRARAAAAAEAEARRRNRTPRRHQPRASFKTRRRYPGGTWGQPDTKKRRDTPNKDYGFPETQSPNPGPRSQTEQTNTGDRTLDQI